MLYYLLPGAIVFAISLRALLRDQTTSNSDVKSWLVIVIASLLWPLSLITMIRKKLQKNDLRNDLPDLVNLSKSPKNEAI